ncbi:VOC family protein [Actinopolymorpha sp. B17G11]|uniref:VOC family protein n=1 Tax=Actinopolymorpha sp. B17G11 TaxID=3160861 RepID=UPI0032E4420B
MNRVVHFEIKADNLDRAERFYANVFGWSFRRWNGPTEFRLITTGSDDTAGINGGLAPRQGDASVDHTNEAGAFLCTIEVDDLDVVEKAVANAGGRQVGERRALPSVGWMAYFVDPEGNHFGALQPDDTVVAPRM